MGQIRTVEDQFNVVSFSNNDGLENWASSWIEVDGDGLGSSTGNVLITNNEFNDFPVGDLHRTPGWYKLS